jgi:hypothetical protein
MLHYGFDILCNSSVLEDVICVYRTILQISRSSYKENITSYVMIAGRESATLTGGACRLCKERPLRHRHM